MREKTGFELRVAGFVFRVACCELRGAVGGVECFGFFVSGCETSDLDFEIVLGLCLDAFALVEFIIINSEIDISNYNA